jgi:V-type H+-transporting ATPase subunit d
MISNLVLLVKAVHGNQNANVADLLENCHPLGQFSEPVVKNIANFEHSASGFADLYQLVLIDTPIGPYFMRFMENCIEAEKRKDGSGNSSAAVEAQHMHEALDTIIRGDLMENSLRKYYLEDFYRLCEDIGGETAEVMKEILKVS